MKPFCYDYPRPGLTVDIVVYTFSENRLKVLLIERGIEPYAGCWALPGGFVNEDENVFQAANRELNEETNLVVPDLQQFFVASDPGRDPRGWTVSSVFIGFIGKLYSIAKAGDDAKNLKWFPVNNLPALAFDHAMIIEKSLQLLLKISNLSVIDRNLLPDEFQLSDLHQLLNEMGNTPEHTEELTDRLIKYKVLIKSKAENYKFNDLVYLKIRELGFYEDQ